MSGGHPFPNRSLDFALALAHHVFGEPDPASSIHHDSDAYTMQRGARQVDAVPACWRLIDHTLLYAVYTVPYCWIGACQANTLTAICKARETFIGDACTLIKSIGTGMAETAMDHVPGMQACTAREGSAPHKGVEAPDGAIVVNQGEEPLRQL